MTNANNTIKKGETVWYTTGLRGSGLMKGEVKSAGKVYITLDDGTKFHTESLREATKSGAQGNLYLSEKDYYDEIELKSNLIKIRAELSYGNPIDLTVAQTREILEIMYRNSKEK